MSTLSPAALTPRRGKKAAGVASVILLTAGILILLTGIFAYMTGDLQVGSLQPLASEVYAAREIAQRDAMPVTGMSTGLLGDQFSFLGWNGSLPLGLVSTLMNIAIGYGVGLLSQIAIFPMFEIHVPLSTNLWIGAWFTVISLVRSYIIRRWFNARLHSAAQKMARAAS